MLQSAGVNICQTPDGKWTNWSINRSAVHDKNTMKGYWLPDPAQRHDLPNVEGQGRGHALCHRLRRAAGLCLAERQPHPDYVDEYDVASQMLNAPIEMVKCETNDLTRSRDVRNRHRGHRLDFRDAHGGTLWRTRGLSLRTQGISRNRGRTSPA